jgi:hypothetical protein
MKITVPSSKSLKWSSGVSNSYGHHLVFTIRKPGGLFQLRCTILNIRKMFL